MAAKYFEKKKQQKCCKEKHAKIIEIFSKRKKQKNVIRFANDIEISL